MQLVKYYRHMNTCTELGSLICIRRLLSRDKEKKRQEIEQLDEYEINEYFSKMIITESDMRERETHIYDYEDA